MAAVDSLKMIIRTFKKLFARALSKCINLSLKPTMPTQKLNSKTFKHTKGM
jgi:hypothetical protein